MKFTIKYQYSSRLKSKFGFWSSLAIFVLLLFGLYPIVADQITSTFSQNSIMETQTFDIASPSASNESSVFSALSSQETLTPIPSESLNKDSNNLLETQNSSGQEIDSNTARALPTLTDIPPHAVMNQEMVIKVPRVQRVDPRANRFILPAVNFYPLGSPYLMLCITSSMANIDVLAKGIDDSFDGGDVHLSGDRRPLVQISGPAGKVLEIFNSFGGLRLDGPAGKSVSGTKLLMRFVAISEPTKKFALCADSISSSQWLFEVQPLGLEVETKKNRLNLGDKKK